MKTSYEKMKIHFDKLIQGGYPNSNYLEDIRTTYENLYGTNINKQDICQTNNLGIHTNPIAGIITLIGPDELPDGRKLNPSIGLIGNHESRVYYVNHFTNFINLPDWSKEEVDYYIGRVFTTMRDIIKFDDYWKPEPQARDSQYLETLYAYPFWFTFHHVKESLPGAIKAEAFKMILNKYYMDDEDIPRVLEAIVKSKYSAEPEIIYSTMSLNGTIGIIG